jgi:diadenosine tetraphosphate (Ap4A) HIT family hydrolase
MQNATNVMTQCNACNWKQTIDRDLRIYNYKNKFLINHSTEPCTIGHLIVMPIGKESEAHKMDISGMSKEQLKRLAELTYVIVINLKKIFTKRRCKIARMYFASFSESYGWHVHFHIIPRDEELRCIGPALMLSKPLDISFNTPARNEAVALSRKLTKILENNFGKSEPLT